MMDDQKAVKLPDKIAQDIVKHIRRDNLKTGDTLPPEAKMVADFGVSRTVVREALTQLSAAGIIETGNGRKPRVAGFEPDIFARQFSHGLYLRDITTAQVMEARRGIEVESVRVAALHRTENNLIRMSENLDKAATKTEDWAAFAALDFAFHLEIAEATQNKVFVHLIAALRAPIQETIQTSFVHHDAQSAWLEKVLADHRMIFGLLEQQRVEAAVAAMKTHLEQARSAQSLLPIA